MRQTSNSPGNFNPAATISVIVLCGMFFSVVFHYVLGVYLNKPYPHSTFLFRTDDVLNDYFNTYEICKSFSPYHSGYKYDSNYFPFANLIFCLFALIPSKLLSLLAFLFVFTSAYIYFIRKFAIIYPMTFSEKFLVFFATYPILFSLDRANLEIYLLLFMLLFFHFYISRSKSILAEAFLAMAISMKLYPGVFLVLYVRDRKYKHIGVTVLFCIIFSVASLLFFRGTIMQNIWWLLDGLKQFNARSLGIEGMQHSSTWFCMLKAAGWANGVLHGFGTGSAYLIAFEKSASFPYTLLVGSIFLLLTFLITKKRVGNHGAILILTCVLTLFPNVSYDYKLMHFIPCIMLFLLENKHRNADRLYAILYGLLLIPKDYLILKGDLSINVPLNVGIMTALLILAILETQTKFQKTVLFQHSNHL